MRTTRTAPPPADPLRCAGAEEASSAPAAPPSRGTPSAAPLHPASADTHTPPHPKRRNPRERQARRPARRRALSRDRRGPGPGLRDPPHRRRGPHPAAGRHRRGRRDPDPLGHDPGRRGHRRRPPPEGHRPRRGRPGQRGHPRRHGRGDHGGQRPHLQHHLRRRADRRAHPGSAAQHLPGQRLAAGRGVEALGLHRHRAVREEGRHHRPRAHRRAGGRAPGALRHRAAGLRPLRHRPARGLPGRAPDGPGDPAGRGRRDHHPHAQDPRDHRDARGRGLRRDEGHGRRRQRRPRRTGG